MLRVVAAVALGFVVYSGIHAQEPNPSDMLHAARGRAEEVADAISDTLQNLF